MNTNESRGLKMEGEGLVNTIRNFNLTRLIHWPIHISKIQKHNNTSIENITIMLRSPKQL